MKVAKRVRVGIIIGINPDMTLYRAMGKIEINGAIEHEVESPNTFSTYDEALADGRCWAELTAQKIKGNSSGFLELVK